METQTVIPFLAPPVNETDKDKPEQVHLFGEVQRLRLHDALDAVIARATVRKLADSLGYSLVDQVRITTAIFEIARDIVTYAGQGEIIIYKCKNDSGRKGLEFFCNDQGLNASRLTSVLQAGGDDTHNKLNFLSLKKLVDQFNVSQDPEYGNCVTIVKWM